MTDLQGLPVFSYVDINDQVTELIEHFTALGATNLKDLTVTDSNVYDCILKLIENCAIVGKKTEDGHSEQLLNCICSLIVGVPEDKVQKSISIFCDQLSNADSFGGVGWNSKAGGAVRVLSNLFHGFETQPQNRSCCYNVYMALLRICARAGIISCLPTDLPTVKEWFKQWNLSQQQRRNCLRLLMESLTTGGQTDESATVMLELLSTYTADDAGTAVSDAHICVRTAIIDPHVFILDHLLRLRPVQLLEQKEPQLFKLLQILVNGSLTDYREFVKSNPKMIEEQLGVKDQEPLVDKMRILTFISLADGRQEVTFGELSKAVDLPVGEQLEEFIIRSIQANAVQAKMDQQNERCIVQWSQQRRFDMQQWTVLKDRLDDWMNNLKASNQQLNSLSADIDVLTTAA